VRHARLGVAVAAALLGLAGAPDARPGEPPSFHAVVSKLGPSLRAGMTSWHRGCPVPLSGLRLLRMTYLGFDGKPHVGELVIATRWTRPLLNVFQQLYEQRFPVRRMKRVEAYSSNDDRVGIADDTSGFNCRFVKGTRTWSEHAFGRAIDLNPVENPQVSNGRVSPPRGRAFLDRSRWLPGMIHPGDKVVRAFASIGWRWGGYWTSPRDYMHFSATGR
jgi:hypothetical protein